MMDELRKAAQLALDALERAEDQLPKPYSTTAQYAIDELRAAVLADREKRASAEPFGYLWPTGRHPEFRYTQQERDGINGMPLYAAPQQAEPWIACSERMPDDDQVVVVGWATRVHPERAIAIMRDGCFIDYTDGLRWFDSPTHWMPLPALPGKGDA
jgi:hypothetical protein